MPNLIITIPNGVRFRRFSRDFLHEEGAAPISAVRPVDYRESMNGFLSSSRFLSSGFCVANPFVLKLRFVLLALDPCFLFEIEYSLAIFIILLCRIWEEFSY